MCDEIRVIIVQNHQMSPRFLNIAPLLGRLRVLPLKDQKLTTIKLNHMTLCISKILLKRVTDAKIIQGDETMGKTYIFSSIIEDG